MDGLKETGSEPEAMNDLLGVAVMGQHFAVELFAQIAFRGIAPCFRPEIGGRRANDGPPADMDRKPTWT